MSESGEVGVLVWNLTLDKTKATGSGPLARDVEVVVTGLAPGSSYTLTHERVDQDRSNVAATWGRLRREGQDWPDDAQWEALRAADRLDELVPARRVTADDQGVVRETFRLPMPAMSLLTLAP